jgi:hypothetical protein
MRQLPRAYRGTFYFVTDATKDGVRTAWQDLGQPRNVRIQEGRDCVALAWAARMRRLPRASGVGRE